MIICLNEIRLTDFSPPFPVDLYDISMISLGIDKKITFGEHQNRDQEVEGWQAEDLNTTEPGTDRSGPSVDCDLFGAHRKLQGQ